MTTVEFRFPASRYHGTAWGRHVNEGAPEWPPSPYRFLRALYDVWKRKLPELPEADVRSLFEVLGSVAPTFWLPETAVESHTRSYLSSNTENPTDKSLIFDAFIAIGRDDTVSAEWPVVLTVPQRATLERLLSMLNYLGRSESWVTARLTRSGPTGRSVRCEPAGEVLEPGRTVVDVACPIPPSVYQGKADWFEALTYSSTQMLKDKQSGPPAMAHIPYARPKQAVVAWLPPERKSQHKSVTGVLLELQSKVLPVAPEAVRVAERVRRALLSLAGTPSPRLLSGKEADGTPLNDHRHLYVLPLERRDGRLDRILLHAGGAEIGGEELAVMLRLRYLSRFDFMHSSGGERPEPEHIRVTAVQWDSIAKLCVCDSARTVLTSTPFVPTRFWKPGRGEFTDFMEANIREECLRHGLPEPVHVGPAERMASRYVEARFRRNRQHDSPRPGYRVEIEFPEPVRTPFSIGYGAHFGLGQFVRLRD